MTRLKNKKYGFTLVEILVVILIIGLLFVFLAPKISNSSDRAKEAGVKTRFNEFRNAATMVMTEHAGLGEVMSSTSDVAGLVGALNEHLDPAVKFDSSTIQGQYCDSVAKDPWNNNYRLHVSDNTLTFISYGHNPMTVHAADFDYAAENCTYTLTAKYEMGSVSVSTRGFTTNIDDDTPNTPGGNTGGGSGSNPGGSDPGTGGNNPGGNTGEGSDPGTGGNTGEDEETYTGYGRITGSSPTERSITIDGHTVTKDTDTDFENLSKSEFNNLVLSKYTVGNYGDYKIVGKKLVSWTWDKYAGYKEGTITGVRKTSFGGNEYVIVRLNTVDGTITLPVSIEKLSVFNLDTGETNMYPNYSDMDSERDLNTVKSIIEGMETLHYKTTTINGSDQYGGDYTEKINVIAL